LLFNHQMHLMLLLMFYSGKTPHGKSFKSPFVPCLSSSFLLWYYSLFRFSGLELSFFSGEFPSFVNREDLIGLVMTGFGMDVAKNNMKRRKKKSFKLVDATSFCRCCGSIGWAVSWKSFRSDIEENHGHLCICGKKTCYASSSSASSSSPSFPFSVFLLQVYTGALVLSWFLKQHPERIEYAFIAAVLIGIGDSTFNTQIYSALGTIFPGEDAVPACT
jgi:hypothetical protein